MDIVTFLNEQGIDNQQIIKLDGTVTDLFDVLDDFKTQEATKCSSCGKNTPEICGSCVSDIAQATGDQAYNSRR